MSETSLTSRHALALEIKRHPRLPRDHRLVLHPSAASAYTCWLSQGSPDRLLQLISPQYHSAIQPLQAVPVARIDTDTWGVLGKFQVLQQLGNASRNDVALHEVVPAIDTPLEELCWSLLLSDFAISGTPTDSFAAIYYFYAQRGTQSPGQEALTAEVLKANGRLSRRLLAKLAGVTEDTLKARIKKLSTLTQGTQRTFLQELREKG